MCYLNSMYRKFSLPGMIAYTCDPSIRDCAEFEATLCHITRSHTAYATRHIPFLEEVQERGNLSLIPFYLFIYLLTSVHICSTFYTNMCNFKFWLLTKYCFIYFIAQMSTALSTGISCIFMCSWGLGIMFERCLTF